MKEERRRKQEEEVRKHGFQKHHDQRKLEREKLTNTQFSSLASLTGEQLDLYVYGV